MKKPQETQKAKALWKMKAAKDAGEECYDPDREDSVRGRNETILALWEEHLKDPIVALDQALKCVVNIRAGSLGPESCVEVAVACAGFFRSLWEKPIWEGVFGLTWIRWIVCVYAQRPWSGMCQGSTGRMASSFSS